MDCVEVGCEGKVDLSEGILVKTSCGPPNGSTFPCKKCGRLHWSDGTGANNRAGHKTFLIGGQLIIDDGKRRRVL